uniref:CCHC-type domain-containing protein n=1 Tax=Kalanchoe fedtschenkoi TaxID=63787 RepID=A0A7N0UKH4_KALFE
MSNAGAAPTGCFKCGRPGHWSRDCPSSVPDSNSNPNPTTHSTHPSSKSAAFKGTGGASGKGLEKPADKPKKAPRTRPKLTPEILLSNDGLGYVLRHFPRAFKYRGRGHEVSDLGNLIGMYEQWHSHLLPYYSFDQFVQKVEQVATSKRVKMAIRDLREKVANGGDPTKLHKISVDHEGNNNKQEAMDLKDPSHDHEDASFLNQDDMMPEDMLHMIFEKANEEASHVFQSKTTGEVDGGSTETEAEKPQSSHQGRSNSEMTEEQKARIAANKQKALERAAARKGAGGSS